MRKLALVLAAAVILASCGSGGSDSDSQDALDAAEQRIAELEEAASTTSTTSGETAPVTEAPVTTTVPEVTSPPTQAPTTAAPTSSPAALMPDVVCMNLQAAQDFIQSETGVFLSLSEDATGAGRSQIMDRNWVVVAQRPAPGAPIGEGDAVLSAVKIEEPNPC